MKERANSILIQPSRLCRYKFMWKYANFRSCVMQMRERVMCCTGWRAVESTQQSEMKSQ